MSFCRFHLFLRCIVKVVFIISHGNIIVEVEHSLISKVFILLDGVVLIYRVAPDFTYELLFPFDIDIFFPGYDLMCFMRDDMISLFVNLE